jgi:predicted DCC family thiol-disulfide oxidoreductase YuxK
VFAVIAYQIALDANLFANNLYLVMLLVFLLTVADSGCSFSLDRVLFRRDAALVSRWSTLLPRLQISIVYFFSAAVKTTPAFLAGHSIRSATRMPVFLMNTWLPAGVAVATAALELFLSVGLWIPRLRRAAFFGGFLLHLFIFIGMEPQQTSAMLCFGVITLAPYLLFLENPPGSRLVIWDDQCGFCRRWIAFFRRFDWLGIHRCEGSSNVAALQEAGITAQQADIELKLSFDGRVLGGFDAIREVMCLLPISFLWAPVLGVPPIRTAGSRLYRRVAERRKCTYVAR